jgi:hypothetical protein
MWTAVSSRSHNPIKIFPFGSYSDEVMLYGTVAYEFKAGGGKEVDWAARVNLVKEEGGKVRMRFYQVYLVSGFWVLRAGGKCWSGLMWDRIRRRLASRVEDTRREKAVVEEDVYVHVLARRELLPERVEAVSHFYRPSQVTYRFPIYRSLILVNAYDIA